MKEVIHTDDAPSAIGSYSQAIRANHMVYISGQIGLNPKNESLQDLSEVAISEQVSQVFQNLAAICQEAGGSLNEIIKLTVYVLNLDTMKLVNEAIERAFDEPYPARLAVGVAALPKGAGVEIDAILAS